MSATSTKPKPEQIIKDLAKKKSNKPCFDCGRNVIKKSIHIYELIII
jgi:hypothetical protein